MAVLVLIGVNRHFPRKTGATLRWRRQVFGLSIKLATSPCCICANSYWFCSNYRLQANGVRIAAGPENRISLPELNLLPNKLRTRRTYAPDKEQRPTVALPALLL
ncbi:MAG: hypothetical protein Q8K71_01955 [Polaromonas sp.]|nr:hypothetical protein [Polaromonas sp.]MDP3752652.1 hypothetical protein [Polaromonas sp.]